jgi:transposase
MPSALSVDLRERVVAAIEEGASRSQAVRRAPPAPFAGTRASRRRGASPPSRRAETSAPTYRIEAHAELILQTYEAHPQIFLRELRDALQEQGAKVSTSSLSRFFARHAVTRKKGRRTRLSRTGRR